MSGPAVGERLPAVMVGPIGLADIAAYAAAAGDDNPLHRDPEIARRAGFAAIPAPGMLLMAAMSEYVCRWPPAGSLLRLDAKFVGPVFVGDEVLLEARVAARGEGGACILRLTAKARGKLSVVAEAEIRVRSAL
ncbi:MAG TPA: MaoC family dehydratase [Devosiaceae bacterium]|jgi:acyl dehydratase|nr:MaoC family dehydratase [Devosiaceae bacterium]